MATASPPPSQQDASASSSSTHPEHLAQLWADRIAAAERPRPFALRGGGLKGLGRAPPPNERLSAAALRAALEAWFRGKGEEGEDDTTNTTTAKHARAFASSATAASWPACLAWARGMAYLQAGRPEQAHRDGSAALALLLAVPSPEEGAGGDGGATMMMMMMARGLAHALCGSALEALAEAEAGQKEEDDDWEDDDEEEDDDEGAVATTTAAPRHTLRQRLCLSRAALHAAEAAEATSGLLPGPSTRLLRALPASHQAALRGDAAEQPALLEAASQKAPPFAAAGAAARLRAQLAADARARLPLVMRPPPPSSSAAPYPFFRALAFRRLAALFPAAGDDDDDGGDDDPYNEAAMLPRVALPACVARRMIDADAGDLDLMLQHPAAAHAQAAELLGVLAAAAAGGEDGAAAAVAAHPIRPLSWKEVQALEGFGGSQVVVGLAIGHEAAPQAVPRERRALRLAVAEAEKEPRSASAALALAGASSAPAALALLQLFAPRRDGEAAAAPPPPSRADLLLGLMGRFGGGGGGGGSGGRG